MIVNYTDKGWQVITQRAHGLLAAQLCAHWAKDKQPARWVETLIATAEHDDVYNEFESNDLLNENGGPRNFKMTGFHKADGERLIQMAATKSAYIALLVARHIHFVHGPDPKSKAFCQALEQQEKKWLTISGTTAKEVSRSYELLEFCDAFSLLLCQGLIQPEQRKIEISSGPDGEAYTMCATDNGAVCVRPWPFEITTFGVSYETRTLSQLTFKGVAQFRKALADADVETKRLVIRSEQE